MLSGAQWQMEFNRYKRKVLHIDSSNYKFQHEINGQLLSSSNEEKALGVIITDNLKSSSNCQAV